MLPGMPFLDLVPPYRTCGKVGRLGRLRHDVEKHGLLVAPQCFGLRGRHHPRASECRRNRGTVLRPYGSRSAPRPRRQAPDRARPKGSPQRARPLFSLLPCATSSFRSGSPMVLLRDRIVLLVEQRHVVVEQYLVDLLLIVLDEPVERPLPFLVGRAHAHGNAIGHA